MYTKPKCKSCGSNWHSAFNCNRKAMHCTYCDASTHLRFNCPSKPPKTPKHKKDSKNLGKMGKYAKLWSQTRRAWIKANPPNHQGIYICHYCGQSMPANEMTLDHKKSRGRNPELRFEHDNLVPCCYICNGLKGSLDHDEYVHLCVGV